MTERGKKRGNQGDDEAQSKLKHTKEPMEARPADSDKAFGGDVAKESNEKIEASREVQATQPLDPEINKGLQEQGVQKTQVDQASEPENEQRAAALRLKKAVEDANTARLRLQCLGSARDNVLNRLQAARKSQDFARGAYEKASMDCSVLQEQYDEAEIKIFDQGVLLTVLESAVSEMQQKLMSPKKPTVAK